MNDKLSKLIAEKGPLLADGATGTNLFEMGLEAGAAPELWNIDSPEKIEALHQGFVDAGSDIILTNSFGGTRHRLKLHNAQDRVFELNKAAAEIARKIANTVERDVIIAGSVGPTGELLAPLGELTFDGAVSSFKEQMEGLKAGGVDLFWVETMSSTDEIKAAAKAANSLEMPYAVTASFDTAGRTMMGLMPGDIHNIITEGDAPVAVGANCGVGASDLLSSILDITSADPNAIVVAKANCGIPQIKGDNVEYTGTPELMHEYAKLAIDAGARIIGGCCGTSSGHLAAMRTALDEHNIRERPPLDTIIENIGPMVNSKAQSTEETNKRSRRGGRRRG